MKQNSNNQLLLSIDNFFTISKRNSSLKQEIIGGVTTF